MAQTGTVKFFNGERGYGFIKPDDGGRDVFVHITAVEQAGLKSLTEGQRISFDVEPDKKGKGPKAVNLVDHRLVTRRSACIYQALRGNLCGSAPPRPREAIPLSRAQSRLRKSAYDDPSLRAALPYRPQGQDRGRHPQSRRSTSRSNRRHQ